MKPIDIRNATFSGLQTEMQERLQAAYVLWQRYGPATTRAAATMSGWDILSLRPRTTDLFQIGLVECVGPGPDGGIYRARSQQEWENWAAAQRLALDTQPNLL